MGEAKAAGGRLGGGGRGWRLAGGPLLLAPGWTGNKYVLTVYTQSNVTN